MPRSDSDTVRNEEEDVSCVVDAFIVWTGWLVAVKERGWAEDSGSIK